MQAWIPLSVHAFWTGCTSMQELDQHDWVARSACIDSLLQRITCVFGWRLVWSGSWSCSGSEQYPLISGPTLVAKRRWEGQCVLRMAVPEGVCSSKHRSAATKPSCPTTQLVATNHRRPPLKVRKRKNRFCPVGVLEAHCACLSKLENRSSCEAAGTFHPVVSESASFQSTSNQPTPPT